MKKILFLCACSIVFFQCKNPGCTDSNAINYDASADEDNGTCAYYGYLTFFTSNALDNGPIQVYVGSDNYGVLTDSLTPLKCGDAGAITAELYPDNYTYQCTDDSGVILSGNITVNAQSCQMLGIP